MRLPYLSGQPSTMDIAPGNQTVFSEGDTSECNDINSKNHRALLKGPPSFNDPEESDKQDYVGFAFDYGKFPKIVAVHSGLTQDRLPLVEQLQKVDHHHQDHCCSSRQERYEKDSPVYIRANIAVEGQQVFRRPPFSPLNASCNSQNLRRAHIGRRPIPYRWFPMPKSGASFNRRPVFDPRERFNEAVACMDSSFDQYTTSSGCLSPRNHDAEQRFNRYYSEKSFRESCSEPIAKVQRVSCRAVNPWQTYLYQHGNDRRSRATTSSKSYRAGYQSPCSPAAVMAAVMPIDRQTQIVSPQSRLHPAVRPRTRGMTYFNAKLNMAKRMIMSNAGFCPSIDELVMAGAYNAQYQAIQEHGNDAEKKQLNDHHWMDRGFFRRLLLHENRRDLLQTLNAAASLSRKFLLFVVNKLLSEKVVENALLMLDNLKRSELAEIVKEKVLSVIQEVIWGHPAKHELWSDLVTNDEIPRSNESGSHLHCATESKFTVEDVNCDYEGVKRIPASALDEKSFNEKDTYLLENMDDRVNLAEIDEDCSGCKPLQGDASFDALTPSSRFLVDEDGSKPSREEGLKDDTIGQCNPKIDTNRSEDSADVEHHVTGIATDLTRAIDNEGCISKNQIKMPDLYHSDSKTADDFDVKTTNNNEVSSCSPARDEHMKVTTGTQCCIKRGLLNSGKVLGKCNEMNSDYQLPTGCGFFHHIETIEDSELGNLDEVELIAEDSSGNTIIKKIVMDDISDQDESLA